MSWNWWILINSGSSTLPRLPDHSWLGLTCGLFDNCRLPHKSAPPSPHPPPPTAKINCGHSTVTCYHLCINTLLKIQTLDEADRKTHKGQNPPWIDWPIRCWHHIMSFGSSKVLSAPPSSPNPYLVHPLMGADGGRPILFLNGHHIHISTVS